MLKPTGMLALALALVALALPAAAGARGRLLGAFAGTAPALTDGVRPLAAASPSGQVSYGGGPVMHSTQTFVIYWDPAGAVSAGYETLVNKYLADVAADSGTQTDVYSVATEYGDATGKIAYSASVGGVYVDRAPYPLQTCAVGALGLGSTPCITDAAIQDEVVADLQVNGWTPGLDRVYFVLTPSGVVSCQDTSSTVCSTSSYCAYHSQVDPAAHPAFPDGDPVIYADIPYPSASGCTAPQSPNGSPADSTVNLMSHEHIEMITDPLVDEPGWIDPDGTEIADKCRGSYGTPVGPAGAAFDQTINGDDYMLQSEFSNAAGACLQRTADDQPPVAQFTSASGDGQTFSFDASASSDPDGHLVSYHWDFGDGSAGLAGAQTTHTFGGSGQRTVTLAVGDNAGAVASVPHAITVGPPPATAPPPPATAPPPPAAASPTPTQTATTPVPDAPAPTTTAPAAPAVVTRPAVAPAAVLPRLSASAGFGALGAQGVDGSFAVNRRAQARVDLLVARAVAVRLHITARADGGPRSAQVIVAQSVLGARGPGRVAWRVRLSRATLRALRRAPATVVTVRLTLLVAGEAPRVLGARRHLHA